jgi:hypothetical protein
MNPLLSGGVLAAALALGQTSEPPTVPPGALAPSVNPSSVPAPPTLPATPSTSSAAQAPQRGPIISFFMREDRPVLSKISSWFRRDPSEPPPATPTKGLLQREPIAVPTVPTPTPPASSDFPRRLPNPSSKATAPTADVAKETATPVKGAEPSKELVQTTAQQASAVKAAKSPIRAQFANKIGRDEKFDWITGQLELENGSYVLYYSTPETVDKYHGRIVLQPQDVNMKELHRGDLVSVRGQLVQRPAVPGMGPVYRLTSANLIERPKL